ncbi:MAG: Type 1 glutamine amidotransferase-like domain-containing protein [Clostridia bacterium]|nr:Type 1 glutamine amidotransferase-like domain-containing protein [Clostridia bacterium]
MKVNILSSGFPNGFTDVFIGEVRRHLASRGLFVFVASDFRLREKTRRYCDHFLALFREKGIVFDEVFIVDYGVSPAESAARIRSADVVWLAGGPTLTQMAHIREYGLGGALRSRDGLTIGMSAGSINMARRVVLARDVRDDVSETTVYEGIGLADIHVEPHWNEADAEHREDVRRAARIAPIHALHDDAFIVERDGAVEVFGTCEVLDEREPERE